MSAIASRVRRTRDRVLRADPQLLIFLAGVVFLTAATGIFETTFNNFLNDTFHITAGQRGRLEFPRELPGFLVAVAAGVLLFLPEVRVASVAAMATSAGMVGLAFWSRQFNPMLLWMILWSFGTHLIMPVRSSIGLSLAKADKGGTRLGQIGGIGTFALIAGCSLVWIGSQYLHFGYATLFAVGGVCAACGALVFLWMRPREHAPNGRSRFVLKRKYTLFYVLNLLFGARKQVFITFGPWVLIKVFGEPAPTIAKLWIVSSVIGIFFQPQLGRLIDRFGERAILTADAAALVGVCLGYGFARHLPLGAGALYLVYGCFVLDHLLFSVGMARDTYLSKIVEDRADLMPSLSAGVSINHFVSMSIPAFGGMLWMRAGYEYVFLAAAGVALLMLVAARLVRVPSDSRSGTWPLVQ